MGILGLTHDENGAALEKLPVTIKVAIGEGPEPGNGYNHPRRLDHFVFKRQTLRGQDVVWLPAPDISEVHGEKPTELGIIFLNDDPREIFRTEYALWTPSGCKCHGELVQIANGNGLRYKMRATRRTQRHPEGETWPGNYKYVAGPKKGQPVELCGDGCPDLEHGDCKPSGDLYFILEKFPTFGAICRLHTSSYRSIRNLSNGLMQIRRLNGGRLTGIKAILKASPEMVSYFGHDGVRHTSIAYILSLEIGGGDLRSLVANMTEPARLLREGLPAIELSHGSRYVVRESESDRAEEISHEFYPDSETARESCANRVSVSDGSEEQLARISDLANQLRLNKRRMMLLIGQSGGDWASLERKLLSERDEQPDGVPADNHQERQGRELEKDSQTTATTLSKQPDTAIGVPADIPDRGFLF